MKDLKILKDAKILSKKEQKFIKGGYKQCDIYGHNCPPGYICEWYNPEYGICLPYMEP